MITKTYELVKEGPFEYDVIEEETDKSSSKRKEHSSFQYSLRISYQILYSSLLKWILACVKFMYVQFRHLKKHAGENCTVGDEEKLWFWFVNLCGNHSVRARK